MNRFISEEVKFPSVNQIQHVFRNRLVTQCNASFHVSGRLPVFMLQNKALENSKQHVFAPVHLNVRG